MTSVVDSPRSRRGPQQASRTEPGGSAGPASRVLREGGSLGPASRMLDGSTSVGPASRTLDGSASIGPASRAGARTPPDAPRTGRTQSYELLHLGDTDLVACVGPCVLVVSNTFSPAGVDALGRGMAKIVHRHGRVSALSFVVRASGPNTTPEARDAITNIVRQHSRSITGAAVVCEGTGFRATAIRSVVTAIHMASRSSHPSKVFAAAEPAIEWLAGTRTEGGIDTALLLEASTTLQTRLQTQLARAAAREQG